MRIGVISILGSPRQNECFWPSYHAFKSGIEHDLIVVHRNMLGVPDNSVSEYGTSIFENKIFDTGELPHKAFGAYKYFGQKYIGQYDYLAFISDDVVFQRDNWLSDAVEMLSKFDKLGFVGTQIFNGAYDRYPHESHCRAPIWFTKTSALKEIKWDFDSDHDGEMKLAYTFKEAGYYGAQIGNKIDTAWDQFENGGYFIGDHASNLMHKKLGFDISRRDEINKNLLNKLNSGNDKDFIISPHQHIGKRFITSQLQPFNGLIIDCSEHFAINDSNEFNFNMRILKGYA